MSFNLLKKDIVIGLGEIGLPIFKLLSKNIKIDGFDKIEKLSTNKFSNIKKIEFMHICIPFFNDFEKIVTQLTKKFNPDGIIIHSTISPNTTKKLQGKLDLPIIYSATRGVHKRMLKDLKRYTKFFAVYDYAPNSKWASRTFKNKMKKCGVKTKERWEIIKEYFRTKNIDFQEVYSVQGNIISKLVCLIYLLDYTSIYFAVLSETDPSPVNAIDFVKKRLR